VRTCSYHTQGCLFIGHTDQEMLLHQELCGYGMLLRQIEQLYAQLDMKDAEIERLTNLIAGKENKSNPPIPNISQILDSMSRGLEKLDEDSTRLFEDAKTTLQKTKTAVMNSSAYQTSLQVLNSIKEVVETARAEFVAKLEELEQIAKHRLRAFSSGSNTKRIAYYDAHNPGAAAEHNATSTSTSTTSTAATSVIDENVNMDHSNEVSNCNSEATDHNDDNNNNTSNDGNDCNITPNPDLDTSAAVEPSEQADDIESDEEFKEFLEASKQEYLREQAARMAEEESIRQAMRLSLMDLMGTGHN